MSSSRSHPTAKKAGRLYLLIPVIALILVFSGLAFAYFGPKPPTCSDSPTKASVMDFASAISIKVVNRSGNQTRYIVPLSSVGLRNGAWLVHTYDSYGTDGRYPLCTDGADLSSSNTTYQGFNSIYVRSTVAWNYTLRDFFDVWGQPLGQNGTLSSQYVKSEPNYVWQMCVGNPSQPTTVKPGNWTREVLLPGKIIQLVYYPTNTAYPGCL